MDLLRAGWVEFDHDHYDGVKGGDKHEDEIENDEKLKI